MNQEEYSEPFRTGIPEYRMAMARRTGSDPEEEVIAFLEKWVVARGVDPSQSRRFGFDVPLPDEDRQKGLRAYEYWISVPDGVERDDGVKIGRFPGGEYIALRIRDPFTDPFTRIRGGWQKLVSYVREQHIPVVWHGPGSCLEEVIEIDGVCHMDVCLKLR